VVTKVKQKSGEKSPGAAGLFDSALAGSVKDSAQQIWLAGMGAFAKAQAEGKQAFEALVKEGADLQKKTQAAVEEHFGEVASKMTRIADDAATNAGRQWGRIESIFEERTARAMKKLGVPSAKDVEELKARIEELAKQLARSARAAPLKPGSKAAAARKPGAKAATARKSAAKRARKSAD
jgi:poly(hydroxyalkanoate) granule-associated protein